jgi:hypothetical protein
MHIILLAFIKSILYLLLKLCFILDEGLYKLIHSLNFRSMRPTILSISSKFFTRKRTIKCGFCLINDVVKSAIFIILSAKEFLF